MDKTRNSVRSASVWLSVLALFALMSAALPAPVVAEEPEHRDSSGEHQEAAGSHGEEHEFHKNHFAVFIGSTEAVEEHGEEHGEESSSSKDDPDFTIGLDYERRLNKLIGIGAMLDIVAEGRREFLVGPIAFLHPFAGAKFFAAPLWERVRESGDNELVIRLGAAWDFEIGSKYAVSPYAAYDMTEEHDIWVLGVALGMGF